MSTSSRKFSRNQKAAVQLFQDANGDADHIKPHAKGGITAVENCQIVSPSVNRHKSDFIFKPREWQIELFDNWEQRAIDAPYMLIAVPGSGKTMASLEIARRWLRAASDRRLAVVVPTDNLREQWRSEAVNFGIDLQTKEFGTNFKHGFEGGVASYQLVANQSLLFRKLCSASPTMVIFDEVHHCGDEAHYGVGIKNAFELAKEKFLMSGTPWKSDGTRIPFVNYDAKGFAVGNYVYGQTRALRDNVIRSLVFDYSRGAITNEITGVTLPLSQEISEYEASQRLRKILDPSGEFVEQQIRLAHEKLMEVRETVPDAGAMAVCIDQSHAIRIAATIQRVTGCSPSIIVSDTAVENDTVNEFRKSKKEWLVSVKKVSEGTDIKRLQVLCYLTTTTSEMFFRQVVGRVSRVRNCDDYEGYVFLPADPRLIRCAQNIEEEQVQALREEINEGVTPKPSEKQPALDIYSTKHNGTDLVLIGSEAVPQDIAEEIKFIAKQTNTSMQKVMQIRNMLGSGLAPDMQRKTYTEEKPREVRMDELRRKNQCRANHLAKLQGIEVKDIHKRFKPQREMTEEELELKLDVLSKECARYLK